MNIEQIVNEIIDSTYHYVKNAIIALNTLADEFYAMPDKNTWDKLISLFEGIQWLLKSLSQIDELDNLESVVKDYVIWNEYVKTIIELGKLMPELEKAMMYKDNVIIGDIILYEIRPIFEIMIEKLGFLISEAGSIDVN